MTSASVSVAQGTLEFRLQFQDHRFIYTLDSKSPLSDLISEISFDLEKAKVDLAQLLVLDGQFQLSGSRNHFDKINIKNKITYQSMD
jgi:hypothetical protein